MRRTILLLAVTAAVLLVASGVAFAVTKIGGPGDNTLYGTDNPDKIDGRAGDDTIYGQGGNDNVSNGGGLVGGFGNDTIYGGGGHDEMVGCEGVRGLDFSHRPRDRGSDHLYGGKGSDIMDGCPGADYLYGGPGEDELYDGEERGGAVDTLYGGRYNDYFNTVNSPAGKDIVYCGGGRDFVDADRRDVLYGCEQEFRP